MPVLDMTKVNYSGNTYQKNLFMFLILKKKLLQIFKNKHGIAIHVIEFNQKNGIQEMMKFS